MVVRACLVVVVVGLAVASCSDDVPSTAGTTTTSQGITSSTTTTSTTPERPTSTTTTAFDPASVEGQVEAAYLKSWDVYAEAVYDLELDEAALAEVYAGDHLVSVTEEVAKRIDEGRAALVNVDHSYTIQFQGAAIAYLIDTYRNHQVLIDPVTKLPIEGDPDEELVDFVTVSEIGDAWKVTRIERLE